MDLELEQRLLRMSTADAATGCRIWTRSLNIDGYGIIKVGGRKGRNLRAHRVAYELAHGPISPDLELDHLCRNRRCIEPSHLEPVTHADNITRGLTGNHNKIKTHCPQGHEYTPENTMLYQTRGRAARGCKTCRYVRSRDHNRARRAREREQLHSESSAKIK